MISKKNRKNIAKAYKKHKSAANTIAGGLNAAAIVFLYTHFVPVSQFNSLKTWVTNQQTTITCLQNENSILKTEMLIANPAFPTFSTISIITPRTTNSVIFKP